MRSSSRKRRRRRRHSQVPMHRLRTEGCVALSHIVKSFSICNRVPNQLSHFTASRTLELSEDAKDQGSYFETSSTIMNYLILIIFIR